MYRSAFFLRYRILVVSPRLIGSLRATDSPSGATLKFGRRNSGNAQNSIEDDVATVSILTRVRNMKCARGVIHSYRPDESLSVVFRFVHDYSSDFDLYLDVKSLLSASVTIDLQLRSIYDSPYIAFPPPVYCTHLRDIPLLLHETCGIDDRLSVRRCTVSQ